MKALFLCQNLGVGGAEELILGASTALPSVGVETGVVALTRRGPIADEIAAAGVPVQLVSGQPGPRDPAAFMRLVRLLQRERPDVVHTFLITASIYGRMAAFMAGVPLVLAAEQNVYLQKPKRHALLERALAARTYRIVACCEVVGQFYQRQVGVPASKVAVVYNAVRFGQRPRIEDRAPARAALGLPADALVLGTLGRLTEQKGQRVLLQAVATLAATTPKLVLFLAGVGPLRDDLEAEAGRLGIADRVRFLGMRRDRENLYAAMDIFVLPSQWEGLSLALVEAMGAGRAVVATSVGGNPEVVTDGQTGLLVPPSEVGALADALGGLISDPARRAALGEAAAGEARMRFSIEQHVSQLAALYGRDWLSAADARPCSVRADERPKVSIVNYTLSMMRGGGETRDLAFATHLRDLGCDVTLISVDPLLGKVRHPITGVPSRLLRAPYFRDLVYRLMVLPKTGRLATFLLNQDFKRFSKAVIDLVADPEYPIDILQAAGLYPVVEVKRRRAVPVIIRNQGGLPAKWLRPYVPKADAIIGDGWDALNFEQALGRELVEVTGGVDSELFRPVAPDPELTARLAGRAILLYVGRFVPLKNLPMLIDAFSKVRRARPEAALVMVGEGALEGQIREQVARLGLDADVTFLGHQPQSRLPGLYVASDLVLLSSIFDNSPNCVLEANACERPVVATRVGGVPRYVTEDENGLLTDTNDADGFAQAIIQLLSQPERAREMGLAGRARILERHSWRKSAEKLVALYDQLLAAGAPAAVEPSHATGDRLPPPVLPRA